MDQAISKSRFKIRALKYLRQAERTGRALIITDHGKPVLRINPYEENPGEAFADLRGSVLEYQDPTEPVARKDWEISL